MSSPRAFLFKRHGAFRSEKALLISSQSRRKLLATASDSSPCPWHREGREDVLAVPGPCPRETQEYLYLPSIQEPLLAQGPALAPGENLGLWPCISSLYSELPSPAGSATLCPSGWCLRSPSLTLKDLATSEIALTSPWAEGPGCCSNPEAKTKIAPYS